MILTPLAFAFFYAVVLTVVFSLIMRRRNPFGTFLKFMVIFFLIVVAANFWVKPYGPDVFGYNWLPGLVTAILVALLLVASSGNRKREEENEKENPERVEKQSSSSYSATPVHASRREMLKEAEVQAYQGASAVFWMLLILLSILVLIGLVYDIGNI